MTSIIIIIIIIIIYVVQQSQIYNESGCDNIDRNYREGIIGGLKGA